jgi:hypothetical protein
LPHLGFDVVQRLKSRQRGGVNGFAISKINVLLKKPDFQII